MCTCISYQSVNTKTFKSIHLHQLHRYKYFIFHFIQYLKINIVSQQIDNDRLVKRRRYKEYLQPNSQHPIPQSSWYRYMNLFRQQVNFLRETVLS